jgi:NAD(P)-dependent dehydrogenase (short-subunit alcohol dehydrogenase family)
MKNYPDLYGKTVLITGATDGIGKELAKMFAQTGCHLILHGRNPDKLNKAVTEISEDSSRQNIQTVIADFSSLTQVRKMAEDVISSTEHLDVLINNAGLYPDEKVITEDGFEQTLQVNYISPFLLTMSLLPLLDGKKPSKIVNLSSIGHRFVWHNLRDPQSKFFWRWVAYCRSKLLMIPFTRELSEQLNKKDITANSIHPGLIRTKLIRFLPVSWGVSVQSGASTVFDLATNPNYDSVTGKYLEKYKIVQPSLIARSTRLQKSLWRVSLCWAGLTIPKAVITPGKTTSQNGR